MEQPKERAPWFSCVACQYRSYLPTRSTEGGKTVYHCLLNPPHEGINKAGEKRWHRVEVTEDQYCGQFIDRKTGETFEERWHRHISREKEPV